ncbi:MAG: hypothetical protein EPN82_02430 [Bacteroidetes bacterium]|nr:MAG: hypothetical protein EPN82_02430 [Bacteroidota bacterium]
MKASFTIFMKLLLLTIFISLISCSTIKEDFIKDWNKVQLIRLDENLDELELYLDTIKLKYKDTEFESQIDSLLQVINLEKMQEIKESKYNPFPQDSGDCSHPNKKYTKIITFNDTKYILTLRYVGVENQRYLIPPQGKIGIKLLNGSYDVSASVPPEYYVRDFYGKHNLTGCEYDSKFYIIIK